MTFDALIFDFDGTILDSYEQIMATYCAIAKEITGKKADVEWFKTVFKPDYLSNLEKLGVPLDKVEQADEIFDRETGSILLDVALFPGIEKIITKLSDYFPKMAICSTNSSSIIKNRLELASLLPYFDVIVGHDKVNKRNKKGNRRIKPDPYPLVLTLQGLDSSPENAIFVGDSVNDFLAGRAANIGHVALCLWGRYESKESLLSLDADEYFSEPIEILGLKGLAK